MNIEHLYRYPAKGLGAEGLDAVQVAAGQGFPLDRAQVLQRTQADFDPAIPAWLPKANFAMLWLHEQIAALQSVYLSRLKKLHVRTAQGHEHLFQMDTNAGQAALGQSILGVLLNRLSAAPRIVEAAGRQCTDKAEKYVSLINLGSVRELEKLLGRDAGPVAPQPTSIRRQLCAIAMCPASCAPSLSRRLPENIPERHAAPT
jgi:uncharacterized protein YcbX